MNVCVRGDVAGGAIQASAAAHIGGTPIALRGDAVASHPPCPTVPIHCSATMTASPVTHIDGVPVVVEGDPATCGHPAVSSTGVTITPTPADPFVPPARVGTPTVTAASEALAVSWQAARLATAYRVEWRSGGDDYGPDRQAVVTGTSYTIPDLVAGVEYTVRVVATRPTADDAPPSAEVTGTPDAEGVVLSAPGSSYAAVAGFLVEWQGDFGELPAAWFDAGADRSLRWVRVDGELLGGRMQIDIGVGRSDLLAAVRGSITLTIATARGSITVTGIGGDDTTEPYAWVPENADAVQAWFDGIASARRLAATFTFRRHD